MYKFAIIDDNHFDQKLILSTLEKECQLHNIEYKLDVYNNSLNFDLSIFYDAIFLDIEMPKEDGFSFAERLNNYYETKIIVVTNNNDYRANAYNIHPFQFINKQNIKIEIINVCNQLFKSLKKNDKFITGYIYDRKKNIRIKDIYYIIVEDHLCYIFLYENKKSTCIRDTIGNIEKSHLSNGLVRINRSTIINMLHIKDIKKNKICLKNNIELIISLGYNKHFEKHYQSYIWGLL